VLPYEEKVLRRYGDRKVSRYEEENKNINSFGDFNTYLPIVISVLTGNPMYILYNMAINSVIGLFERTIDRSFKFIENNDISFHIKDGISEEISMRFAVRPHSYFDTNSQKDLPKSQKDFNTKYMDVD
jgi:hypothetical protein